MKSSLLLSFVVRLQPLQPASIPADQGRAIYSTFLEWVARVDGPFATAIHDNGELKPFTVSSLQGGKVGGRGELSLDPENELWLRVTTLDPNLTSLVLERILPTLPEQLSFSEQPFRVLGTATSSTEHPWAAQLTYEDIIQEHLLRTTGPSTWLNCLFSSPTTFRVNGNLRPFPLPDLIFNHWLDSWNQFAPVRLPVEARQFAADNLVLHRYRLESIITHYYGGSFIGFVGQCTLRVLQPDPYWLRVLRTLAVYSFYCGTGYKTTHGLGQTRVKPEKVLMEKAHPLPA